MNLKYAIAIAALIPVGIMAQQSEAATVSLKQNEWLVIQSEGSFGVKPISRDGSFSYSYGFSDTGCGDSGSWSCMPTGLAMGAVQSSFDHNFGYGWSPVNVHGQIEQTFLAMEKLFLFFRVNSGSADLTFVEGVVDAPAPVPLPMSLQLLLCALMTLGAVRARKIGDWFCAERGAGEGRNGWV